MTRDEAVAKIQQIMGHRGDLITQIQEQLKQVQRDLESNPELPFFMRTVSDPALATAVGVATVAKPTGFIREWDEAPFSMLFEDRYVGLVKDSPAYLRQRYVDATRPMGYSEIGASFYLYPTPMQIYSLQMVYYGRQAVLDSNIENGWLEFLPNLLIGQAGFIVASGVRDAKASEVFAAMASAGTAKLNTMTTAQDEAGSRRIMGGED